MTITRASSILTLAAALVVGVERASAAPQGASASESAAGRQADRERAFEEMLSDVRLVGQFTLEGDGADTTPRKDEYVITRVSKQTDGLWRFDATMKYGEREFPVAIALPVEWAGDTPVITVTDMMFPGVGKYTARVLLHGGMYAGTWSGGNHMGTVFGRVVKNERASNEGGGGAAAAANSGNWPSFRGPNGSGVGGGAPTVASWNADDGTNILWSTGIPGLAHSSPVVWDDRVFVTSAVSGKVADLLVGLYGDIAPVPDEGVHQFNVYCLDRSTGAILWERTAIETTPKVKRHTKGSHAASSPATDGKHVVAFFASEGLYCYDVDGNLLWKTDLGVLDSGYYMVKDAQWGFASSPVIHEDKVIVQCDVQENSFLAAISLKDGTELWRTPRKDVPTWSTPTVDVSGGRRQVIVNGWQHIGGYDLDTGAELWKLVGGGDIPVPTPVVADGLVYITNAHGRMAPIYAIRTDATGTITASDEGHTSIAWWIRNRGNYMQTPLVYKGYLYCCNDAGVLACYEAATGKEMYRERLGGGRTGFTASIVAADDKIYATSEEGEIHVVRAGPSYEHLGMSEMRELCMATPAVSNGVLFVRARHHLFAIGERPRSN